MNKLLEIGLSGWLTFLFTLLIGSGLALWVSSRRRSRQSNVFATGDVAGGDILKGNKCDSGRSVGASEVNSVQSNIVSGGDVAGGTIDKRDK